MEVVFIPTHTKANECSGKVFKLEMHFKQLTEAGPRSNIGMHVKGLPRGNMPRVGDVMVLKSDAFEAARMVSRPLKHVQVATSGCAGARPLIPWTAVFSCPLQQAQMAAFGTLTRELCIKFHQAAAHVRLLHQRPIKRVQLPVDELAHVAVQAMNSQIQPRRDS